jgi:P-type Cu2+ transporter
MTLPCCTFDDTCVKPFMLAGEDANRWVSEAGPGLSRIELIAPQIASPDAIPAIENGLRGLEGVTEVRVNLTARRVLVTWKDGALEPQALIDRLLELGFGSRPFDPRETGLSNDDDEQKTLLRALAVAGFAAANVMLLSVSVWAGASDATRDLFHWFSALIALPAVIYSGRPFFRSAAGALRAGTMNMDVPISLGVILASAMSLFETIHHSEQAYFDASVTLLFFLLTGRYLDHLMRARARSAVAQLVSLAAEGATVIGEDGERRFVPARALKAGQVIAVAAGDKLPADGVVVEGSSEMDRALLTGESAPEAVRPGASVHAGEINLTAPLTIRVTAAGPDTFLGELVRLMLAAEQAQSNYIRLADRLARYYSPAVHTLAAATLAGWLATGHGWHEALMAAVAVLLITCPCALGLAVPAVQVVASGRLFRNGVMIKSGAALEKLAAVDTVIFDKTGTLTRGRPLLVAPAIIDTKDLAIAAGLAQASRHPLSRALVAHAVRRGVAPATVEGVSETPGHGLAGVWQGQAVKLGSRAWCGLEEAAEDRGLLEFAFKQGNKPAIIFAFEDQLRPDAASTIAALKARGLDIHLLSGDREAAVARVADGLGIEHVKWRATPDVKLAYVEALKRAGRKVLMVGDGINDAPALAAGFTSMAPSTASDVGRTAAETVFMVDSAAAISATIALAARAQAIAKQNFTLAAAYNVLAVPLAMAGLLSPLIAAVAMSTSSIMVIANALRIGSGSRTAFHFDDVAPQYVDARNLEKAA